MPCLVYIRNNIVFPCRIIFNSPPPCMRVAAAYRQQQQQMYKINIFVDSIPHRMMGVVMG